MKDSLKKENLIFNSVWTSLNLHFSEDFSISKASLAVETDN